MGEWVAPYEVPFLIGYLIAAMVLAAVAALAVGWVGKWRFPGFAIIFGSFAIPVALLVFAIYVLKFYPDGPPPNDAKAMAAAGLLFVAVITCPFTAASSVFVVRRATR